MIKRIYSDLESFKSLEFKPGLNILVADRVEGSSDKQTRNSAGKSSLVELIDFIFGGTGSSYIFKKKQLSEYTFSIHFEISGTGITASRSGKAHKIITFDGDSSKFCLQPEKLSDDNPSGYQVERWTELLGHEIFGLDCWSSIGSERSTYSPTFRMLFPYFLRREYAKGFLEPQRQNEKQQPWDVRVSLSYLIGLDESIPARYEKLKQLSEKLKKFKSLAGDSSIDILGSSSDIRTKLTIAEKNSKKLADQVAVFRVVDQYKDFEAEASRLTRDIKELNDGNVADEILLNELNDSIGSESPPSTSNLLRLYEESGVLFPNNVKRRFDEVEKFHKAIVENRKAHLTAEISSAQHRIRTRNRKKAAFDLRRSEIMGILKTGGALDHFLKLQQEAGRLESEVGLLRKKLELAQDIENTKAQLAVDRAQLDQAQQNEFNEKNEVIKHAILIFEELSEALYENERSGSLHINPGKIGPDFEIKIDGERSKGISNMQIFCFDMMLMQICRERGIGPDFLVHDSHIFDGVDERQVAKALQLGAERSASLGIQYIVTMNSDALPTSGFEGEFKLEDHVLTTRLTDETETGGLFGLRF